jgi:hypothetical protein
MINAASEKTATSKRDRRMFFGVSLPAWENTMVVSLIVAGGFAFLAGLATWAVVRLQRIEIAESNARQAEAELKLAEVREKLGRPRHLDNEALSAALKGVRPIPVEITLVATDPDSNWLAFSIRVALEKMGWPIVPSGSIEMFGQTPPLLKMCTGNFGGISVLSKTASDEETKYLSTSPRPQRPNTPFVAMWDSIWKAVGPNETGFATCPFVPEGQLHIVVAPRWVIFPKETKAAPGHP